MSIIAIINLIIAVIVVLISGYGFLFSVIAIFYKPRRLVACEATNRYAVLICAKNESHKISNLLLSIQYQTYPHDLFDVFVMADNCTDNTAEIGKKFGAIVYERFDKNHIGKGYALEALYKNIQEDYGDIYKGYFIIDADVTIAYDFLEKMNYAFCEGHEIVTGFHNTGNIGNSFFSMGQGLMFFINDRIFNLPRTILGLGAYFTGTGILISATVLNETCGWQWHMITEDLEFAVSQRIKGRRAYHCYDAIFYDNKNESFSESHKQNLRWVGGYRQVLKKYSSDLYRAAFLKHDFSCYDMLMCYLPWGLAWTTAFIINLVYGIICIASGMTLISAFSPLFFVCIAGYLLIAFLASICIACEWNRLMTTPTRKILIIFLGPLYFIYLGGVIIESQFSRPQW